MTTRIISKKSILLAGAVLVTASSAVADSPDSQLRDLFDGGTRYTQRVEFPPTIGAAGNPVSGQANFGIAADGISADPTQALFNGNSAFAGPIEGDGRTCFTCHRPGAAHLGLPPLPLHASLPADDVIFTGLQADNTDSDPLALPLFDEKGLLFHRPNRFNPLLDESDPLRQVFFWRRSTRLLNTVFTFGFLNDGRMRHLVEVTRGAVMTHTQNADQRFDDIIDAQRLRDISAFMEQQIDPPELAALLDSSDPMYDTLVNDPFYTVHTSSHSEQRGQNVFQHNCMSCHNTPNVFGNIDHVDGVATSVPPHYGHPMDIGVAQRNAQNLEFRRYDEATDSRIPVVIPLIKEDGTVVQLTVVDDVGTAAATGRYEDLHRFKVPQLRRVSQLGPYFHDNSMATLSDVIDYFDSDDYNHSADGKKHPIHLSHQDKSDLLAFLNIL